MLMQRQRALGSQATMSGMGSVDEELDAMLRSGHHSHAQTSLASVMAPSDAAGSHDVLFSSQQYSSLQGAFPTELASSLSDNVNLRKGGGGGGSGRSRSLATSRWPFATDEKWVLDAKNEALESAASLRSSVSNFGAHLDAPPALQGLNSPLAASGGGLQRYHSAPSSFLQCLADFNEDAFSQVSSPLGNRDSLLDTFFADNLTPIIEVDAAPEKAVSSSGLNDYQQFLAAQTDFGRRSSPAAAAKPAARSMARSDGLGSAAAASDSSFGLRSSRPAKKNHLIRQSSSPAELLAALQDSMDESDPAGMHVPPIPSPDGSLSGGTSEETAAKNGKTLQYARDDCFLMTDTMASGSVWNQPSSPGQSGGKRLRVPGEMTDDHPAGLQAEGALRVRVGEPGSLTRHQSLPMTRRPLSPGGGAMDLGGCMDMGLDDLADFSTPCRTRARRGFATHPRSIAERVRRTRISERMKKLQDLVPNMDRQTNTSDMLDEAVEYVKQLQLQVQELSHTVVLLKELQQAKERKSQALTPTTAGPLLGSPTHGQNPTRGL